MPTINEFWNLLDSPLGMLAAVGIFGALKDRPPFAWLTRRLITEPVEQALDRRIDGNETVQSIYKELHPNGGTSLRDAVDRTELRVARVEKHVGLDHP